MTTMIERVARALHEKMCEQDVMGYLAAKLDAEELARVAIEAMREMTDAMVAAAWESRMADVQGQWSDVIDAALTAAKREHE